MSYCKREGKDKSIFVTKEDVSDSTKITTLAQDESYGLITSDGDINWDCPCLGGMAQGPCGSEFKNAFGCFHYSKEEMKGSDCLPQFREMQECFQKYPEVYGKYDEDEEESENKTSSEKSSTNSENDTDTNTTSTSQIIPETN